MDTGKRRIPRHSALVLLLGMLVAGCGVTTTQGAARTTLPLATATATVTPLPTDIIAPTVPAQPCSATDLSNAGIEATQQGDVLVSDLTFQPPAYPGYQLPENLPLAPYKVPDGFSLPKDPNAPNPGGYALSNPAKGFALSFCNTSTTQPHTVSAVAIKVGSFTPYSGHLNEMRTCVLLYARQGNTGGGCGGAAAFDAVLAAAFPANAGAGDVAVAQDTTNALPVTVKPGQNVDILINMTLPTTPGTYTFLGGVALDGGSLTYAAKGTPPALYAPVAHAWDGQNCTQPSMQSQIPPATDPPTYYLCPTP